MIDQSGAVHVEVWDSVLPGESHELGPEIWRQELTMDIGVRELRDVLSRYLASVRDGHTITVTDHGHPVARIVPVGAPTKLEQLIAEGKVTPAEPPKSTTHQADQGGGDRERSRGSAATVILYLDTSALVPLMIDEPTSSACGELWDGLRVGVR